MLLLGGNGPLNRHRFCPLHNRGDDRATDQIAAVKRLLAPTAQRYFQEFVLVAARKLPVDETLNQTLDRRAQTIGFLGKNTVVRKIVGEIDAVDFSRAIFIWPVNFYLSIDSARAQNCRIDQIGAIGGKNNDNVVE